MGIPLPRHPGYTLQDWAGWEGRWELIHGVAYAMTPAPNLEHQRCSFQLEKALDKTLDAAKSKGGGECEVFHAPLDLFLPGQESVYQPDIVVVCDPAKKTPRGIEGAPDLVVEILSPATAQKDWTHKRWAYEAAGIPEYLIVDPDERIAVLLRLENGRYEEVLRAAWGQRMALLGGRISVTLGA